jgi:uncharacterized protein YcbX
VGVVREIWRYPVKSLAGERMAGAEAGSGYGLPGDRSWAVRDEAAGEIRGAKKLPGLLQWSARCLEEPRGAEAPPVEIRADGGPALRSDDPRASDALSAALGRRVRLCPRRPAEDLAHYRRAEPIRDMEAEIRRDCGLLPDEPLPQLGEVPPELLEFVSPPGTYFDAFELHLLSDASLAELARLAPRSQIDVRRFRPNLLVRLDGVHSGFPELAWCGRSLRIGDARTHVVMPTLRCAMVTWAQAGLPGDPSIMRALVRGAGQNLGVGLSVTAGGAIAEGDPVHLD